MGVINVVFRLWFYTNNSYIRLPFNFVENFAVVRFEEKEPWEIG